MRISASTAWARRPHPPTWCCITTAGSGLPSIGVRAGSTSTACGCRRSSSTTVGRSILAIHSTGPGWCSNSAPRRPRQREPRRPHRCGPRRRPLHHQHRGPFNTADRWFRPHRRARRPAHRHQIRHAGRRNRRRSGHRKHRRSGHRNHRHRRRPPRQRSRHHTPGHRKHRRSGHRNHRPPPRQRCRHHTSGRRKRRHRNHRRHRNCSQNWCQPFLRPGADGTSSSSG
ncbi:MAG: hypothetical protein QOG75_3958 [Mycobacterium sp.]|nr:hypothetical protein [Mycobacterium sp.]